MREFRIDAGFTKRRCQLLAVYADEDSDLGWVESHNGSWRLPSILVPWALEVDQRARETLGHKEIFPCPALFERMANGSWEVEIFPEGAVGT
ncbi:hypothetical protein ACFQ61_08170 [Streptomyces sp. NPDC056500]|uniref:hypothetical protein n=1 Tax=Streptomyces sp. NPDC056500 TaxID=3345840 RepID=UPI003683186E